MNFKEIIYGKNMKDRKIHQTIPQNMRCMFYWTEVTMPAHGSKNHNEKLPFACYQEGLKTPSFDPQML